MNLYKKTKTFYKNKKFYKLKTTIYNIKWKKIINTFNSIADAVEKTKIGRSGISKCCRKEKLLVVLYGCTKKILIMKIYIKYNINFNFFTKLIWFIFILMTISQKYLNLLFIIFFMFIIFYKIIWIELS